MVTISLLVLVGCDNYEFVNTDEYLVVKKDDVREFSDETTWKGLNILSITKIKYTDGKVQYKIKVSDIDGEPIKETDYFEKFKEGSLLISFRDKDNFELHNLRLEVKKSFSTVMEDNIQTSLSSEGSFDFEESKFVKINMVSIGTHGM
tara:strand:+ start:123 stop:566 length:444 start_codon:yes stop_codon:yes gene_type:complete